MDYLLQKEIDKKEGIRFINEFIDKLPHNKTGMDPYPISLRGINWIKFLSKHSVSNQEIDHSLYAQYEVLNTNLEYHLLGNHLLENGFALLFGAFYFQDSDMYKKAIEILKGELKEQILEDGGHFELSPMYHQIILDRLLDCVNLLQNNKCFDDQVNLLKLLEKKAGMMLGWLKKTTFQNGDIPHFNDSTDGIAPTTDQLLSYASRLNLQSPGSGLRTPGYRLSASGYRMFSGSNYECIVDAGPIGPDYIPGHGHADMLSFVLYVNQKPIIVDTGISTYEKNEQRQLERSTISHNTVVVNGKNQSDVWGGFRVGKRARIVILVDEPTLLEAEHDGFKPTVHNRKFDFVENNIRIIDNLSPNNMIAIAYLHFHHERKVELLKDTIIIDGSPLIEIINALSAKIEKYQQPLGYNKYSDSNKIEIRFKQQMEVFFKLN